MKKLQPSFDQASLLIKDLPSIAKPREKLTKLGAKNLTDQELIAILLRSGTKNQSVIKLANKMLNKYPLNKLQSQPAGNLQAFAGVGPAKTATLLAAFELAKRLQQSNQAVALNTPQKVFYQSFEIKDKQQEHCLVLYVNGSRELLQKNVLAIGSLNQNFLEFRQLLAPALNLPAAGIILVHNHPSGDVQPSQADISVTQQVAKGANLVGVKLIDHVIVASKKYFSFRNAGLLD
jgi:DNA repair protein RadC